MASWPSHISTHIFQPIGQMNFSRRNNSWPRRRSSSQSSVPVRQREGEISKLRPRFDPSEVLNLDSDQGGDPHDDIVRFVERNDGLAARLRGLLRFILVSKIAVAGGSSRRAPRSSSVRSRLYGGDGRGALLEALSPRKQQIKQPTYGSVCSLRGVAH